MFPNLAHVLLDMLEEEGLGAMTYTAAHPQRAVKMF